MAADVGLDALLFEMAAASVRLLPLSFGDKAARIARQTSGRLLFEVRVDGDPQFQRIAAVRYVTGTTGILALSKDGLAVVSFTANGELASFIDPLESWDSLPLREQARSDVEGHINLLLAALRSAGCMPYR
ncbi:hypothetical protein C7I87_31710 [Mesorhizobium sp. SARCC-RB16n]|uniref:hypothetical protein n=1 Tax=Mesorhizobium sp. SARCC-RB16n TaxID=2116687 RepID=UPI00122F1C73|nr:hypothetical protein [Mesorhizobium sp. SARCC-RB16n]KAA3445853.1 hypothetical protein C7I87_31710 [Mesorhizobium sp. SARCC-RB16n]